MKIFRRRGPDHSYGYIRANFFERIYLRGRIAAGDTGLREVSKIRIFGAKPPGPASVGAQFIITAKEGHSKCARFLRDKKIKSIYLPR